MNTFFYLETNVPVSAVWCRMFWTCPGSQARPPQTGARPLEMSVFEGYRWSDLPSLAASQLPLLPLAVEITWPWHLQYEFLFQILKGNRKIS